jgi:hemerythrin superfamily protein
LDRIHDKVRKADPNTDDEEQELLAVLKPHNDKEESALYPGIDQFAGPQKAADLFLLMEEIPQERFQSCCGSH